MLYTHKAGGSNPSSPTICLIRLPAMGAFRFWTHRRGIRTRQGAELRKRDAFSSEAREGRRPEAEADGASRTRTSLIAHHLIDKAPSDGGLSSLGPSQRDSNPTGCEAEETRSVFQRSTRGAKRRSESGRRQPHATPLIAHHLIDKAPSDGGLSFLDSSQRESNPKDPLFQGPWSKNGKNEYCYFACNI